MNFEKLVVTSATANNPPQDALINFRNFNKLVFSFVLRLYCLVPRLSFGRAENAKGTTDQGKVMKTDSRRKRYACEAAIDYVLPPVVIFLVLFSWYLSSVIMATITPVHTFPAIFLPIVPFKDFLRSDHHFAELFFQKQNRDGCAL